MKTRFLLPVPVFMVAFCFSTYLFLSVAAHRPLTPSEFSRFSSAFVLNAAFHSEESGGTRTLLLMRKALSNPVATATVEIGGHAFVFPLPEYSVRQQGQTYLTFVTDDEFRDYLSERLPAAGWRYVDQMGAGHFYERDGAKMLITERFYLGTSIRVFEVSIVVQ